MRKFLKLFSVFAVICCCMFTFVGCDIFKEDDKTENEYASLIAERGIVREVINNTCTILKKENETSGALLMGTDLSLIDAESEEIFVDMSDSLIWTTGIAKEVINENDFVPGKLYSATIEFDGEGDGYYLINAYCGEGDFVTLNIWATSSRNASNLEDIMIVTSDIYYNNKHEVIKIVNYERQFDESYGYCIDYFEYHYDADGKFTGGYLLSNWENEKDFFVVTGENRGYKEEMTSENEEIFDNIMNIGMERTNLFSFARALSQEAQQKIQDYLS